MAKLIPLEEAAKILGMTEDELSDLRSRNEIFGYRDGSSWKFKEEEVQRVAANVSSERGGADALANAGDVGDDDDLSELVDISDSSAELSLADDGDASGDDFSFAEDDELKLAPDGDKPSVSADEAPSEPASESEGDDLVAELDDLQLAGDDDVEIDLGDSKDDEDFSLSDDSLDLEPLEEEDLALAGESKKEADSGVEMTLESGSDVDFALDDLADSSESESDLGAFELSDDDMITLGDDDEGEAGDATQLQSDDDFLLTPAEEAGAEDSESGSQIIELDEPFEDSAEPLITDEAEEPFLEEAGEPAEADQAFAATAAVGVGSAAETEYSIWNVLGLVLIFIVLAPTGVMMLDLIRNMWSWNEPYALNSQLMDAILSMFG